MPKIKLLLRPLILSLAFFGLYCLGQAKPGIDYGEAGSFDFIEFWSAGQLAAALQNPYDWEALNEVQRSLGRLDEEPRKMWHPPWILTVLAPILFFSFSTATCLWALVSLFLTMLGVELSWRIFSTRPLSTLWLLLISLLFAPIWNNLAIGQIGSLLIAACAGSLLALKHRQFFVAGLLASVLTVKIHLFILPGILSLYWVFKTREWRVLTGGVFGMSLLITPVMLINPDLISHWRTALSLPPTHWVVASLVGWIRIALGSDARIPIWPMVVVPGMAASIFLLILIRKNKIPDIVTLFPSALSFSLFVSPYAWLFDQTLLLIPVSQLLAKSTSPSLPFWSMIAIYLFLAAQYAFFGNFHHHFAWGSLAVGILYVLSLKQPGQLIHQESRCSHA